MILEQQIEYIINEQNSYGNLNNTIKRNLEIDENSKRIIVISGVRRCGKSTLLKQKFANNSECLFLSFEDPRLENFEVNDFYKIEKIAEQIGKQIFIFDEIQNIPEWEKYVRSAHDREKRIFVTGSNASMLSKELGTRLTGRYKQLELYPFDFKEYLNFKQLEANAENYKTFLQNGGFPEFLNDLNPEYLQTLLKDIVIRDIAIRRKVKNEYLLIRLAVFLMSNIGKEISYNNITQTLSIKSVRTTIDYCDFFHESYLFEFVPRFSFSIKQQQVNSKKVYAIDTGMARANSLSLQDDWGRKFENEVYLQLRRYSKDIQYFKDEKTECDFILKLENEFILAIQVCWILSPENIERELAGLRNAMKTLKINKGIILTLNQEDKFENIEVIPIWKWKLI